LSKSIMVVTSLKPSRHDAHSGVLGIAGAVHAPAWPHPWGRNCHRPTALWGKLGDPRIGLRLTLST
jgi:hypothetical protein